MRLRYKILIISMIILSLGGLGYLIYWHATHSCVEWEVTPTGSKCIATESYASICTTVVNGKTSVRPCRKRRCTARAKCRYCTKYAHDDDVPPGLEVPGDEC